MKTFTLYIDGYFNAEEGKILEKVRSNNKTFKEVLSGFGRLGYRYEGTWYWTNKDINGFCWDEFEDVFQKMADIQEKFFGKPKFNYHVVDVFCGKDKNGKYRTAADCPGMCSADGDEKVVKFKDKDLKGVMRTYYCFWNPTKKYYYIINVKRNSGFIGGWHDFIPAFEGWITIKTRSVSDIEREYKKIAEENKKRAEESEKRAAEEKKIRETKEKYEALKKAVHDYWKDHKEEFKKVEWEELPERARKDFRQQADRVNNEELQKIVDECEYFRYYICTGGDPGYDYYDVLVADRKFKNCFIYETEIRNRWSLD